MARLSVALLAGGWSAEREVSLKSGEAVYRALDPDRYKVTRYDPKDDLIRLIQDKDTVDIALVLLHGRFGEDGRIQGFLDLLGIPFVGSGVLPSALALNKRIAKEVYRRNGLNVPEEVIITRQDQIHLPEIIDKIGESLVVKPVSEGSSLGMSLCHSKDALAQGIELAFQYDREIMVEQYIQGREVTGVQLWFERGRVVKASAEKNEDFLLQTLDTDAGTRCVGEFAIGTNEGISRFTRQILFDEKISGSFHMAIGAGYPETGSQNESAIHWDMICDLRDGGEIWVDDELLYKDGRFVIEF